MLIRMSYDRPVGEIKAAVRASARPRNLDNLTKDSSVMLYRLWGNLVMLYPRIGAMRHRFSGVLRPTKDGGTRLTGIYGITPAAFLAELPILIWFVLIGVHFWRDPITALLYMLMILLLPFGFLFLMSLILSRLTGDAKECIRRFLQDLGKEA